MHVRSANVASYAYTFCILMHVPCCHIGSYPVNVMYIPLYLSLYGSLSHILRRRMRRREARPRASAGLTQFGHGQAERSGDGA
eukprot:5397792-Pyramimonas_sp.AAC.1